MPQAVIKLFPDKSGCQHSGVGVDTPPLRRVGNAEFGFCPECKFEIAFYLDAEGQRTWMKEIVQIEEQQEPQG